MDLLLVKYEAASVLEKEMKLPLLKSFQNSVNEILAFRSVNSYLWNILLRQFPVSNIICIYKFKKKEMTKTDVTTQMLPSLEENDRVLSPFVGILSSQSICTSVG